MDLILWEKRAVMHQQTAMVIKMVSKVGSFFHLCFVCCHPGGRLGDREQVITLWQCPEASCVAVDMLHRVMHTSLYPGPCMTIKMAHSGGALDPIIVFLS